MFQSTESAIDEKCCKPCCDDGESVQAEAYCTSCKKGLCATCVIAHRKQMRSHRIFDKIYDEESYEQCERHPKEFIKYYCPKHDSLICGHCSVLEHGSCKVEIISELCKSDYESINDDNADLLTNSDGSASKIENNMDLITEKDKTEELLASQIDLGTMKEKHVVPRKKQLFGNEIEVLEVPGKKLQSTESAIDENADLLSNSDGSASKIENNMDLLTEKDTTEELIASEIDLGTMKEKHVVPRKEQLFGNEMEVPGKKLQSTESAIDENADLLTNNDGSASKIENNMDLLTEKDTNEELIASEIELGTMKEKHVVPRKKQLFASCITKELVLVGIVGIVVIGIIVQVVVINKGDYTPVDLTSLRYTRAPDIQVNGSTREILLLPENRLLIADWGNKTSIIEMLDLLNNNLMFEVSLPSRPRSMCILPEERLAVSLPGIERIQFLNTLGELSLDGNIKVDGECLGIGYHNDKLIVSYRGGKVEVMDMTGKVIKMIDKDDSGQAIFHIPLYLYVVSEAQTAVIYVSDFGKSTITKLDMDLKTLQTFQDPALTEPTGITEVGNQLLICGHDSNNIMVLDLSSGKMTQLLGEVEGFVRPLSVCYIHKQNKMYVSLAIKSPIIVYKVDPN